MANINAQVDNIKKTRKIIDYAKIENDEIEPVQDWNGFSTETLWFILSGSPPEENDSESESNPINDDIDSDENDSSSSDSNINFSEDEGENSTSSEENNDENNLEPSNDNINEGE